MSDKKINLEEILHEHVDPHCFLKSQCYERVIDAMKEACRQVLELAAENVNLIDKQIPYDGERAGGYYTIKIVDKQSILNTLKQIK